MPSLESREIRLKVRPTGTPTEANFELATVELPAPGPGEVLVRNLWMSVDPYMRPRMTERESYIASYQVGQPLDGGAIGEVIISNAPELKPGDHVSSFLGWREQFVARAQGLMKVDGKRAPLSAYLGVLGMPGLTAYAGLLKIAGFKDGQTVFVSAAAGAVGSIVCQIAKIKSGTVIASAGSDAKCTWLKEVARVDAAINYRTAPNLTASVKAAAPKGLDIYFDNVGGAHLEAALTNLKQFGRIAACGMIGQYNSASPQQGPTNIVLVVSKRLRMEGFIVSDHLDLLPPFIDDMGRWVAEGKIKWEETVMEGIESAPRALLGLFKGENLGKMLVKLA